VSETATQKRSPREFVMKALKAPLVVALVVILPALPSLVLNSLGLGLGSGTWVLSAISVTLATVLIGPSLGWKVAIALPIAMALGVGVSTNAILAGVVMGGAAALYGVTARWGSAGAVVTAPIALAFMIAEPPMISGESSPWMNAAVVGLVSLSAAAWGLLVGWIITRYRNPKADQPTSISRMAAFSVMIGLATGFAMWFVVDKHLGHTGAWIVLTILVVFQPYIQDSWTKSLHRLWGTCLGFAIALAIGLTIDSTWILTLMATAFLILAVATKLNPSRPYWLFAAFLTPAVVLLEGSSGSVVDTDRDRLVATVLGVAISLALIAISQPIYKRSADRLGLDHY